MEPFPQTQLRQQLAQIAKRFYLTLLKLRPDEQKEQKNLQRSVIVLNNSEPYPQQEQKGMLIDQPGEEKKLKRKKKYRFYSVSQKQMIVDEIKKQLSETNYSLTSIIKIKSEQYGIHSKNISRWYKLNEIKEREGGRKPAFPQIQQKLIKYICQHPKIKRRDVINYAKRLYDDIQVDNKKRFIFSKGWYERFKVRNQGRLSKYKQLFQSSLVNKEVEDKNQDGFNVKLEEKEQEC